MVNIGAFTVISAGDAVLASVVSNNFTQIAAAVNSNALNSDNYGQSSILSQHIATNAILSQHISDNAVGSGKIASAVIAESNMNYASSADGVRVVRIGDVASNMPANGVNIGRYSQTYHINSVNSMTVTVVFSNAIDGNPGFTATPVFAGQPVLQAASTVSGPEAGFRVTAINSASAVLYGVVSDGTQDVTVTVHAAVLGGK